MIAMPGARADTASRTASITSARNGDASLPVGSFSVVTVALGSLTTFTSCAFTSSIGTPGKMRQLTLTFALCGRALSAWPACAMVATQVVRTCPTNSGRLDRIFAAAGSPVSAKRRIACPTSPPIRSADSASDACVSSLRIAGNSKAAIRSIAFASL